MIVVYCRLISLQDLGRFILLTVQRLLSKAKLREFNSFRIVRIRNSFHNREARYFCNRHITQLEDGTWYTPSTKEIVEEAGLYTIDTITSKRGANQFQVLLREGTFMKNVSNQSLL